MLNIFQNISMTAQNTIITSKTVKGTFINNFNPSNLILINRNFTKFSMLLRGQNMWQKLVKITSLMPKLMFANVKIGSDNFELEQFKPVRSDSILNTR
jgi:hypothetical protein